LSPEEYLAFENPSPEKHEYYDGKTHAATIAGEEIPLEEIYLDVFCRRQSSSCDRPLHSPTLWAHGRGKAKGQMGR
jgi:hypothetical protein